METKYLYFLKKANSGLRNYFKDDILLTTNFNKHLLNLITLNDFMDPSGRGLLTIENYLWAL